MAEVFYEDPIEHLSGKISKKKQTIYNYRRSSRKKYTSARDERLAPPSAAELAQREKFKVVRKAADDRLIDPNYIPMDQVQFRKEIKAGAKYTTMQGWLIAKGFKLYDPITKTVTYPTKWE